MPLKRTEVIQYKSDIQMHMYLTMIQWIGFQCQNHREDHEEEDEVLQVRP